jgi:hypothetical protein
MPEKLERSLMNQAKKKGLTGEARDKYVYGTMTRVAGPKGSKKASETGNVRKKAKA